MQRVNWELLYHSDKEILKDLVNEFVDQIDRTNLINIIVHEDTMINYKVTVIYWA